VNSYILSPFQAAAFRRSSREHFCNNFRVDAAMTMMSLQQFFLCLSLVVSTVTVLAWSPATHHMGTILYGQSCSRNIPRTASFLSKQSEDTNLIKDETGKESVGASFGVSYIGGDPCGSKYNNDPFDATKEAAFKPGFPDEMKDRIAALAAKKLAEQESD